MRLSTIITFLACRCSAASVIRPQAAPLRCDAAVLVTADQDPGACAPADVTDRCWSHVAVVGGHLRFQEILDASSAFCRSFEAALVCSTEFVESVCSPLNSSRGLYDFWIRGLETVFTKLCLESILQIDIVENEDCWDAERAESCLRAVLGVRHVGELLLRAQPYRTSQRQSIKDAVLHGDCLAPSQAACSGYLQDHVRPVLEAFLDATDCGDGCLHQLGYSREPPSPAPTPGPATAPSSKDPLPPAATPGPAPSAPSQRADNSSSYNSSSDSPKSQFFRFLSIGLFSFIAKFCI